MRNSRIIRSIAIAVLAISTTFMPANPVSAADSDLVWEGTGNLTRQLDSYGYTLFGPFTITEPFAVLALAVVPDSSSCVELTNVVTHRTLPMLCTSSTDALMITTPGTYRGNLSTCCTDTRWAMILRQDFR